MRLHRGELFRRQRQQFARPALTLVPAFQHPVNHGALPRGGRFRIQRVERAQAEDRLRVELVGIAAQPVDRGDGQRHVALLRRWHRFGLGIGRCGRGAVDLASERDRFHLAVLVGQLAQHGLHSHDEAAGNHRPALIAQGMAQHHFRCAERPGKVMRGQADAELRPRHAQRTQHGGGKQRFGRRAGRPAALGQPGADHQVGTAHPRFQQAIDRDARVAAPRRAHCHAVHRIAQHGGQIARADHGANRPRALAQVLDEGGQRAAIGPAPQRVPAQSLAARAEQIERVGQRHFLGPVEQRGQHGFHLAPPAANILAVRALGQLVDGRMERRQARRGARAAQFQIERTDPFQPVAPPLARADQRVLQQRQQRHRRGGFCRDFGQQQQRAARRSLR